MKSGDQGTWWFRLPFLPQILAPCLSQSWHLINPQLSELLASFCAPDRSLLEESQRVCVRWCLSPQTAPDGIHHICEGICVAPSSVECSLLGCPGSSSAEQEKQSKRIQTHLALVSWATKVVCLDTHDQARLSQGTWALKTWALAAVFSFSLSEVVVARDNGSSSEACSLGQTQSLTRKGPQPSHWVFIPRFMDTWVCGLRATRLCNFCECS